MSTDSSSLSSLSSPYGDGGGFPGNNISFDNDAPFSYSRLSAKSLERYFVKPMDLSEPEEDMFGFTQVCSLKMDEISDMKNSKLNKPVRTVNRRVVPSFEVRLWSRASGRYLCILPVGAAVYARAAFGPAGPLRMLVKDDKVIAFQSTANPRHHLSIRAGIIRGYGTGGLDSNFRVYQNGNGYCTFESMAEPGRFIGVRENGNIMLTDHVTPDTVHAQFIIQKEAMDLL